jgi:hypothetical protein
MKRGFVSAFLTFAMIGCTHSVHQVAVGGLEAVPAGAHVRAIEAEGEQFVFFYMTGNTDYADEAYQKLLAQCPHGQVVGVESRFSTSLGFLSYTNRMKMRGLCLEAQTRSG